MTSADNQSNDTIQGNTSTAQKAPAQDQKTPQAQTKPQGDVAAALQNDVKSGQPFRRTPPDDKYLEKQVGVSKGKEYEAVKTEAPEKPQTASLEYEVPKEVDKAGVVQKKETIELPPDVKKLGVKSSGSAVSVQDVTGLPQVSLPISDDKVLTGLHEKITNAFRWLSEWCVMRLKKAHIKLKVVKGKVVRVKG